MLPAQTIAAITQRDRFLKRAVETRRVYAVSGDEGLARVPSRRMKGRDVTLIWSQREDAERWAGVVASHPRVKELGLAELVVNVLPVLASLKRFTGVDWTGEGAETEIDAGDLAERIRLEALEAFVHRAMVTGKVWVLEDAAGPALLVSQARSNQYVLPCWAEHGQAELHIRGPWRDMMAMEIPLEAFVGRKLLWLADHGHLVSPGHIDGAGTLELQPADLEARFAGQDTERKAG
jgi:hypothetical protein